MFGLENSLVKWIKQRITNWKKEISDIIGKQSEKRSHVGDEVRGFP